MPPSEHKRVFRRLIQEVFNNGRLAILGELLTTNFVDHSPCRPVGGTEALRERIVLQRGRRHRQVRRGAVRRRAARRAPRGGDAGEPRLRQPDGRGGVARGRDGARSRFGRWDRRDPVGQARRRERGRLWPRHDRRDACAGTAERGRRRRPERPLSQGRDRGDPASRGFRRRRDLELRDQSVGRQAGGLG